ncbi:MAG: TIGR02449 family protein [Proteobacteria bacterium]|nr:MAG: TIGR02449 family protein [Pseudomonadota bacterium]PIE40515.1 MAG: TIGR02449 family protein [Gammaproteobacteria bacterium]
MEDLTLDSLSKKIDALIHYCNELKEDNAALRSQQEQWNSERATLMQKNDLARNKIEAMIGRLKALEQK